MRCLSLADGLRNTGWQTFFISRQMPAAFQAMLQDRGHEFCTLPDGAPSPDNDELSHSHWLGTSQSRDSLDTIRALSGRSWNWLVVDHYALDARWESALRQCVDRILVIDDLADRSHDCDILLDQNLVTAMNSRYDGKVPSNCRLLLGPRFALLKKEFANLHESARRRSGSARRILILMGGADMSNQTEKVVRAISEFAEIQFDVDVVVGLEHPKIEDVKLLCEQHGFRCHVQPSNVAALMEGADISIGACGTTTWERCCLGVPTICMTLAANQVAIAEGVASYGAALHLGDAANVSEGDVSRALRRLIDEPDLLMSLSSTSLALVDGKGVERVCDLMRESS